MNKRNTEGFALAYVVIVIAVLTTLSLGLMSISLRILQVQDKNMQRMQDKYAAQGAVELFVASLPDTFFALNEDKVETITLKPGETLDPARLLFTSREEASSNSAYSEAISSVKGDIQEELCSLGVDERNIGSSPARYTSEVVYQVTVNGTTVVAVLGFSCEFSAIVPVIVKTIDGSDKTVSESTMYTYGCKISDVTSEFVSYEIITEGGGAS